MIQQLLTLCLLALIATTLSADTHHAIVPYEGSCQVDKNAGTYSCRGKGQSADFVTRITASGEVHMSLHKLQGSISVWTCNGTIDGNTVTQQGTFSFGIHNTHGDHTLSYSGTGVADTEDEFYSVAGTVHGGKGAWAGASGVVSVVTQHVGEDKYVSGAIFFVDPPQ